MSTIDPMSPLLARLRAEALAWQRRGGARAEGGGLEQNAPPRASDWLGQVAQAVVAIRRDDPQRQRKAFRIYLQAVLARECGIQQPEDPAFQSLVERVQDAMDGDERLRSAMVAAGDMLLQTAGK